MKLLIGISITSLVLTIVALVFVLGLYEEIEDLKTEVAIDRDRTTRMSRQAKRPNNIESPECQVLAKYMASSLTVDAGRYFANAWSQADCKEEFNVDKPELDLEAKAQLRESQVDDLIESYNQTSAGKQFENCLWRHTNYSRFNTRAVKIEYNSEERIWNVEATGGSCKGIEYFTVDDVTGEVSYLGSSLNK